MKQVEQAVAAGLRTLKQAPVAFVFIDGNTGWTWDLETIFEIPVYHTVGLTCHFSGANRINCQFIPLFETNSEEQYVERRRFAEAYSEAMI